MTVDHFHRMRILHPQPGSMPSVFHPGDHRFPTAVQATPYPYLLCRTQSLRDSLWKEVCPSSSQTLWYHNSNVTNQPAWTRSWG